jgi:hypothetical protein
MNSTGTGGLDFWVGVDGSLHCSEPCATTRGENLGGLLTSDPDASMSSNPNFDPIWPTQMVFGRGQDGQLWYREIPPTGGAAGPWSSLGGQLTSGPGASATKNIMRVDVFVRGIDGGVWKRQLFGHGLTDWEPIGGQITSDPDAATNAYDLGVDAVARGVDGGVWIRSFTQSGWGPWSPLGGQVTSGPSISSDGQRTVIAARGIDGGVWLRERNAGTWGPWYPIGGSTASDPDVRVDVFGPPSIVVRGADGALSEVRAIATTWQWSPLPYGS